MSRVVVFLDQRNSADCLKSHVPRSNLFLRPDHLRQIAKYIFVFLLLPMVLSACAIEGDFGRPQPTIIDRIADELLPIEEVLLGNRRGSGVTDDEMAMREAGHRLSSPLIAPSRGAGPYGRSSPAGHPLAAIEDELKSDHQALTQFGIASRRVLATGIRRAQAVYSPNPNPLVGDRRSVRDRMRENFSFIEYTFANLARKMKAIYYAIDEFRPDARDAFTSELEGLLNHLRERAASLEYELTNYFGAAVARGEYQPSRFASRDRLSFRPPVADRQSDQSAPILYK